MRRDASMRRPISRSHPRHSSRTAREMRAPCVGQSGVATSRKPLPPTPQSWPQKSQMITIATATAALSPPLNLRHATELRDRGYTVIPDAGISADLVKDARFAVASEFSRLLDNLEELGIDPVESSYAFKELDKRHANRWSVRPTQAESAWTRLVDSAVAAASPVVETLHAELPPSADDGLLPEFTSPMARSVLGGASRLLPSTPKVDQIGAIVSRPGAGPQRFHADAGDTHLQLARLSPRHRLFNVFCPLVDLEEGGDGTMLWPASHLERKRLEYDVYCADTCRSYLLERDERAMAEMAVPACPAGGLLDLRLPAAAPRHAEHERPRARHRARRPRHRRRLRQARRRRVAEPDRRRRRAVRRPRHAPQAARGRRAAAGGIVEAAAGELGGVSA